MSAALPIVNNDGACSPAIHGPACAAWVQTHTGLAVDLMNPQGDTIHPKDIAVSLARLARFNGHTIDTFSVAQHSVLVLQIVDSDPWLKRGDFFDAAPPGLRLAALLHDGHEAYCGDITSPVASLPGFAAPVAQLKNRLQRAIHRRFGLPEVLPAEWRATLKRADAVALATEKRDLMAPEPRSWGDLPPAFEHSLDLGYRYWLGAQFEPLLRALAAEVGS
jgi:hypothetical protein